MLVNTDSLYNQPQAVLLLWFDKLMFNISSLNIRPMFVRDGTVTDFRNRLTVA